MEQVNRTAVAVAIDVPGPRQPGIEIGAVAHKSAAGASFVTFELANTGNVHLRPAGTLGVRGAEGVIDDLTVHMDSIYAGTQTVLEVQVAEPLAPGSYCAWLMLADDEAGASAKTDCMPFTVAAPAANQAPPLVGPVIDAVTANPIPALAATLASVAAVAALYLWRRRRSAAPALVMGAADWPPTDPIGEPAPAAQSTPPPFVEDALIAPLRQVAEVSRAWLIRHDSYLELAIELAPATDLASGSTIASALRSRLGNLVGGVPLRVVVLGGPGVIARRTGGQPPVYQRDARDDRALVHERLRSQQSNTSFGKPSRPR